MVEIIWALPGNAEFRRNCAQIAVRYLGGDETLVEEIRTNRKAQACLAQTQPDHPACVFGQAVDNEVTQKNDTPGNSRARRTNQSLETPLHRGWAVVIGTLWAANR